MLSIYTDGGCRNNPGLGAWAFVSTDAHDIIEMRSDVNPDTTNNQMELTAIYEALKYARHFCCLITIYSDSQYSIKTIMEWAPRWKAKNELHLHKNSELIANILVLYESVRNQVSFEWVKGHSVNPYNILADRLVNQTMDSYLNSATSEPPSL